MKPPLEISLVFPPFFLESLYNLPPLGLINLATLLKRTPHHVVIHDFVLSIREGTLSMGPSIYEDCANRILSNWPDLVGFSAQCTTYPGVIQIARIIKEQSPQTLIVVGGHNASFVDQETLAHFPFIDIIVRGEGEITFPELVEALSEGRDLGKVQGITYRKNGDIVRTPDRPLIADLDQLPLPDYTLAPPLSRYKKACSLSRSIAILEVGRGCPHRCAYCSESILWRRRTRTFSPSRIVDEMELLHKDFGADCFVLAYDQFTARKSFVEEFCGLVIQRGLNHLPWYCISRLDTVDGSILALMNEAGCESMCYGIDSGSKRTLAFIHKNIDHDILYDRVRETAERGMVPTLSFVIGFPEEERQDIDETLTLALRAGILGNNNPLLQMPTVLPGTELYQRYLSSLVREVATYFALGIEFDDGRRLDSDEELIDAFPSIFSSFYNLPCKGLPLEELDLIATYFPLIVQLYPRTFLLLSIEYGVSVSRLFVNFLEFIRPRTGAIRLELSSRSCYEFFGDFSNRLMEAYGPPKRGHITDLLRYENLSIEAAKCRSCPGQSGLVTPSGNEKKPKINKKILLGEFDFDIPEIILDLKRGEFDRIYEKNKTYLLFQQSQKTLEVSEINAFARDLLLLCDGDTTIEEISARLKPIHGREKHKDRFLSDCMEALGVLSQEGIVEG